MSKILDKRKKIYRTKVSSDDPEVFRITGDKYRQDAKTEFLSGNYRQSFLDNRNAAKCYMGALHKLDPNSKNTAYKRDLETMYLVARVEGRKAALYEATEKTPIIFRGIFRRIKGRHILTSFIFVLLFSASSLTGNVVGNTSILRWSGIGFFLLGVFLSYFFVWGKILVNKTFN